MVWKNKYTYWSKGRVFKKGIKKYYSFLLLQNSRRIYFSNTNNIWESISILAKTFKKPNWLTNCSNFCLGRLENWQFDRLIAWITVLTEQWFVFIFWFPQLMECSHSLISIFVSYHHRSILIINGSNFRKFRIWK